MGLEEVVILHITGDVGVSPGHGQPDEEGPRTATKGHSTDGTSQGLAVPNSLKAKCLLLLARKSSSGILAVIFTDQTTADALVVISDGVTVVCHLLERVGGQHG